MTFGSFMPSIYILALLAAVILLPNSLELLARFQPALDWSGTPMNKPSATSLEVQRGVAVKHNFLSHSLVKAWRRIEEARSAGVSLGGLTAVLTALICLLGILSLTHSESFVYGHF